MANSNTIRYVIENMNDADFMYTLLSNMNVEDLENFMIQLDNSSEEVQDKWTQVMRKIKFVF